MKNISRIQKQYIIAATILLAITISFVGYFAFIRNKEETVNKADDTQIQNTKVVMFHNGTGPMCLEAMEFFEKNDIKYSQYLNTDPSYEAELKSYKQNFLLSEGISSNFGYFPIIFVGDRVFSGFNEEIGNDILETTFPTNN